MSDAAEWLTKALDRREAAAKAAADNLGGAPRWAVRGAEIIVPLRATPDPNDPGMFTVVRAGYDDGQPVVTHIAAHDPAWVLADIEAKRAFLDDATSIIRAASDLGEQDVTGAIGLLEEHIERMAKAEGWTGE